eukprot:TRINITY_DN5806_c0_g1_i2.p1 TRINITY_DN5806_c0_g1~~TRINITY_DN5806_c0_g1_i2.p1  ORF type:complete len:329 (-),score=93.94 TRINITY_DN5806_c0_g1_i2:135-1121(-)
MNWTLLNSKGKVTIGYGGEPPVDLYVGNVDVRLSESQLFAFFQERYVSVLSARLMKDLNGVPRGFAFIKVMDPQEAELAIDELQGQLVSGRGIKVRHALGKKRTQTADTGVYKFWIDGLPPDASELSLVKEFAVFGPIVKCSLCAGQARACVQFASKEGMEAAQQFRKTLARAAVGKGSARLAVQVAFNAQCLTNGGREMPLAFSVNDQALLQSANLWLQGSEKTKEPPSHLLASFSALLQDPRFVQAFEDTLQGLECGDCSMDEDGEEDSADMMGIEVQEDVIQPSLVLTEPSGFMDGSLAAAAVNAAFLRESEELAFRYDHMLCMP